MYLKLLNLALFYLWEDARVWIHWIIPLTCTLTFLSGDSAGKEHTYKCRKEIRDVGSIPGLGRSPGEGNGNIFKYSYLANSMDRGPWWATVHGVVKSDTTELCMHTHYFGLFLNSIIVFCSFLSWVCSRLIIWMVVVAWWQKYPLFTDVTDNIFHLPFVCMRAKSLHSCQTLCDPMDCSPPGSSVHGILQAKILEWVAMPSSRGSSWRKDWTHIAYIFCVGRQVLYH